MTILKINKGDLLPTGVEAIGWTDGDGTGHDGYHVSDYVDSSGRYLGPDGHGIEPIFRVKTNTKPNTKMTSISINEINSAGIQAQGKIDGITVLELIGTNGKPGDAGLTAYWFGRTRVIETNGDPIWEECDPEAFTDMMEEIEA